MGRDPVDVPLTWDELQAVIREDRVGELGRLKEPLAYYHAHNAKTLQTWATVGDFIVYQHFNFPIEVDEATGKQRCPIPALKEKQIRVVTNHFRYAVDDHIHHNLIWVVGGTLSSTEINDIIAREFPERDCIHFINPPAAQSIRNIFHVHVFSIDKH